MFRKDACPSVEDLFVKLQRIDSDMDGFTELLERQPMEGYLRNLQATADSIASAFPRRPTPHPRYAAQWSAFVSGKGKALDGATIRYFCWEPKIATSSRFLTYVAASEMKLSSRALAGLVRSCHHEWSSAFPASAPAEIARCLVRRYDGQSPVILRWQSNLEGILGIQGPELLGHIFFGQKRRIEALTDEWYLDFRSPFLSHVVETAASLCRDELGKPTRDLLEFLFGEVLSWPGWEPAHFRKEAAGLILHGTMSGQTREILQRFLLLSTHLGDPRLEVNRAKWAEMPRAACDRMRLWLTENPFGLLEPVYQEGRGWTVRPSIGKAGGESPMIAFSR